MDAWEKNLQSDRATQGHWDSEGGRVVQWGNSRAGNKIREVARWEETDNLVLVGDEDFEPVFES